MKILIFGQQGFIGSNLTEVLRDQGSDVYGFDLHRSKWFDNKNLKLANILDKKAVFNTVEAVKPDVIYDCCGILGSGETFDHIEKTLKVNILGTLNVLEAAKRNDVPLIYISLKNKWLNPYMISKRCGTQLCQMYYKYLNTKTIVIKGLNAYGPRQKWNPIHKMLPTFITSAINGEVIKVYGSGDQIVDMIHVKDMAKIAVKAYQMAKFGTVFDVGSGIPRSVNSIVDDLKLYFDNLKIKHIELRKGEPERAVALANPDFVRNNLFYKSFIPWKEGLKNTIKWYKQNV